ncbi:MAG: CcoQ/FixQ family Cbb3-type cytochrome c oxidase assembly chaperone [Gammaproteobacteria bacterium]|nr:CcoQ/FixQ family Cbb3-type cytochrome c oxidase assembly chaperone [Gammaproteobacteria bacterium]MDH5629010.1 CcoQ/FixQ family Cbb3-type cytochrome c oxidase assembly chaperone [Gammaproteobacteria bacterium]
MDLITIRSLVTLFLLILFVVLFFQLFSKKNKQYYENASNIIFDDGDDRSQQITAKHTKVKNHE